MIARDYQLKMFARACDENIIAFLPTGTGKTYISVMLIDKAVRDDPEKKIVFLAPTVPLVIQQADYIRNHTGLNVATFVGDGGKNTWQSKVDIIAENNVIVLTPSIFFFFLMTAAVLLPDFSLIVVDECHHCTKGHPYNLIFKDFYFSTPHTIRPRVFGMTACPVTTAVPKGGSSVPIGSCDLCSVEYSSAVHKEQHITGSKHAKREQLRMIHGQNFITPPKRIVEKPKTAVSVINSSISDLEKNMDSKIITVDGEELQKYADRASEENLRFHLLSCSSTAKIIQCIKKNLSVGGVVPDPFQGRVFSSDIQPNSLQQPLIPADEQLINIFRELGSISLYFNVTRALEYEHSDDTRNFAAYKRLKADLFTIIDSSTKDEEHLFSDKMRSLFRLIDSLNKSQGRMIIFTQERKTALILNSVLNGNPILHNGREILWEKFTRKLPYNSHIILGRILPGTSHRVVKDFRAKKFNILVATSVAEEGIDIESCNVVVCFDTENMIVRSYTQRKGRARSLKSKFVFFSEARELEHLQSTEKKVIHTVQQRESISSKDCSLEQRYKEYIITPLGAKVTEHGSYDILCNYTSLLPQDYLYVPKVEYSSKKVEGKGFIGFCNLPANCSLENRNFKGKYYSNLKDAERSAGLAACQALYKHGVLDGNLLPHAEIQASLDTIKYTKEAIRPLGTFPMAISAEWISIPASIPEGESIDLYDTCVFIRALDGSESRQIHFLSKKQVKTSIPLHKGLQLSITVELSKSVRLTATQLQTQIKIHELLVMLSTKSTLYKYPPREISQQKEYLYLSHLPDISYEVLSQPLHTYPRKNIQDMETLCREVKDKVIWLQNDAKKFLYYVESVNPDLSPLSIIDKTGYTYREHYYAKNREVVKRQESRKRERELNRKAVATRNDLLLLLSTIPLFPSNFSSLPKSKEETAGWKDNFHRYLLTSISSICPILYPYGVECITKFCEDCLVYPGSVFEKEWGDGNGNFYSLLPTSLPFLPDDFLPTWMDVIVSISQNGAGMYIQVSMKKEENPVPRNLLATLFDPSRFCTVSFDPLCYFSPSISYFREDKGNRKSKEDLMLSKLMREPFIFAASSFHFLCYDISNSPSCSLVFMSSKDDSFPVHEEVGCHPVFASPYPNDGPDTYDDPNTDTDPFLSSHSFFTLLSSSLVPSFTLTLDRCHVMPRDKVQVGSKVEYGEILPSFAALLLQKYKENYFPSHLPSMDELTPSYLPSAFQITWRGYNGLVITSSNQLLTEETPLLLHDSMRVFHVASDELDTIGISGISYPSPSLLLSCDLISLFDSSSPSSSSLQSYVEEILFLGNEWNGGEEGEMEEVARGKWVGDHVPAFTRFLKLHGSLPHSAEVYGIVAVDAGLKENEIFLQATTIDNEGNYRTEPVLGTILISQSNKGKKSHLIPFQGVEIPELTCKAICHSTGCSHPKDIILFANQGGNPTPSRCNVFWDSSLVLKFEEDQNKNPLDHDPCNKKGSRSLFHRLYNSFVTHALLPQDEVLDEQPLLEISRLKVTRNYAQRYLKNYWKTPDSLYALPQSACVFPLSAFDFQANQILSTVLWEMNHAMLIEQFMKRYEEECDCNVFHDMEQTDFSPVLALLKRSGCQPEEGQSFTQRQIIQLTIQMAFTTPASNISFNYELLETTGDSFLKFAISEYVFHTYPHHHEGILTSLRGRLVSNAHLDTLALDKDLQRYIMSVHRSPLRRDASITLTVHTKLLADIAEALIGAFFVLAGHNAAIQFLSWLGLPTLPLPANETDDHTTKRTTNDAIWKLEKAIGYIYKNPKLGDVARCHISAGDPKGCFQRLEFLGDAVLDILVISFFIFKYGDDDRLSPGTLSALKSGSVSNITFTRVAVQLGFGPLIRHRCGAIKKQYMRYLQFMEETKGCSENETFLKSLTYPTPKILADVFEAVVGSVYLDTGRSTSTVWKVFYPLLAKELSSFTTKKLQLHPSTTLYHLQDATISIRRDMDINRVRGVLIFNVSLVVIAKRENPEKEEEEEVEEILFTTESRSKNNGVNASCIGALISLFTIAVNASC